MARYTKPELREQIKEEVKGSDKGGRPGQWSARKSQLVTQEYKKRGGGFLGPRDEGQKSLRRWGEQKWQTREGDTRARHGDETKRYLPEQAWKQLSPAQRRATDAKKRRESRSGKQYVTNTGPAKRARKGAASAVDLTDMPVSEATKHVHDLDTGQLRAVLHAERDGKARKTLLRRLESELNRR